MNATTPATLATPATDETAYYTDRLILEIPPSEDFDELVLPEFTDNVLLPPPDLTRHATGSNMCPFHDQLLEFFDQTPVRASPIVVPGAPVRTVEDLYRLANASLGEVSRQLFGTDDQFDDPMDVVVDDVADDEFQAINNAIQNGFVNTESRGQARDQARGQAYQDVQ